MKKPKLFHDDQSVIIRKTHDHPNLEGKVFQITHQAWSVEDQTWGCYLNVPIWYYNVRALWNYIRGGRMWSQQEHLDPVYDGDQKISWDECAWKPKELVK